MARKMKDSGIEWIGEIPEGWELRKGKSLYRVATGKLDANAENPDGDYPFFTCSMAPKRINSYSFDCEALLVAGNGLVGFTQYYKGKFDAYQRTYVLSDFRNVLPSFLRYYVSVGLPMEVQPKSIGSVIQFIKLGDLLNFNVTLPSIEQQTIISNYLEFKIIQIDAILSKTRSSIEEYKKFKQAIITQAVTKGVRGERVMKDSGVEWIGKINHRFSLIKLKYICSILDQYRKPISADKRSQSGSVLYDYYGASGAIDKIDDYTIDDHVMLIGEDGANLRMRNLPLMYEVNGKAWINNHAHILKPTERVDFYYLFYALEELDINPYITGSAQPKLSQEKLQNIWVPLPDLEEQQEIATYIRSKCAEIDKLIAKKEQLVKELDSYKKSLIYEVVTGKREV